MASGSSTDLVPTLPPGLLARAVSKASRLSNWENLGRFGRRPVDQVLVLFPIASVTPELVGATTPSPTLGPVAFYAGLALLFAATCLHRWRAPHLVQRHRDSFDYVRAELEVLLLEPATQAILRTTTRQLTRHGRALAMIHPDQVERLGRSIATVERCLASGARPERAVAVEWMLASWLFLTHTAPLARAAVAGCYGAGTLLLVVACLTLPGHFALGIGP